MAVYLVTGGCGYLGSRLVGHLVSCGHYVRVLDNLSHGVPMSSSDCMDLNIGDVCNGAAVMQYMNGVDGCFHLADASEYSCNKNNLRDIKTTLTGAFNIFSAAAKYKVKVVYISSAAIYGDNAELPLNENSEPCPLTPYAADKRALELHAKVTSIMDGVPTVGLRLFNVYGERYAHEYPGRDVISNFIQAILKESSITIYGDGEQMRDYVYVDDAIRFILSAMALPNKTPELFNVCSGEGVSINELARRIMCLTQSVVKTEYKPSRSGDIYGSIGCPQKAFKKLRCKTTVSLNTGLEKLIHFYRKEMHYSIALKIPDDEYQFAIPTVEASSGVSMMESFGEEDFCALSARSDISLAIKSDFLHDSPRHSGAF